MSTPVVGSISEFVLRAAARPAEGDWLALMVPASNVATAAQAVASELATLAKRKVVHMAQFDNPRELVRSIRRNRESLIVVSGLEQFTPVEWKTVDGMRSLLEGMTTIVFVVSQQQGTLMLDNSPNISSWLAGGIWELENASVGDEQRRSERLAALRRRTSLSDDEVVQRAQAGTLDNEPLFAEWLALLGREDLIGR